MVGSESVSNCNHNKICDEFEGEQIVYHKVNYKEKIEKSQEGWKGGGGKRKGGEEVRDTNNNTFVNSDLFVEI